MENLALWVFSVLAYEMLFLAVWETWQGTDMSWRQYVAGLGIAALLTLPVNVNGHVFTLFGNATGEKGVYSISSLYQRSDGNVISLIGLTGYQKAGQNAVAILGIAGYQEAGQDAAAGVGIVGYQKAGRKTTLLIGLSGYQEAGHWALTIAGIAGYQKVGSATRTFGAIVPLETPEIQK